MTRQPALPGDGRPAIRAQLNRRDMIVGSATAALLGSSRCLAGTAEAVSLMDYLPSRHHEAIRSGRGDFDCAAGLQLALRETAVAGAALLVPRGAYALAPTHELAHADRTFQCLAAVRLISGMRLVGEKGAVFRMVPGYSSDRRPRAMAMFGADEALADIALSGLVLDMNGRRNPISPGRKDGAYNRFPQAQIFVSSKPGRQPALIDRIRISDTEFRDANGVSCIVMAQNDDRSARLGRGWTLERCSFRDNGLDTDDHSSVFAYAEDVTADQCMFTNEAPFAMVGINTAYEIHGSRQHIRKCHFRNALRGIWVANNYASETRGAAIEDNDFDTLFYGVDFFHDRPQARAIADTRITGNRFRFDDRRIAGRPQLDFKAAVQIASDYGQTGIRIAGNTVTKIGHRVTSAFLVVTGAARGSQRHDDISATGNSGSGLTFGSFLRTSPTAGLGRLTILRNRWSDLAPSELMQIAAGVAVERTAVSQPVKFLALGGGSLDGRVRGGRVFTAFINTTIEMLHTLPLASAPAMKLSIEIGGSGRVLARIDDGQ